MCRQLQRSSGRVARKVCGQGCCREAAVKHTRSRNLPARPALQLVRLPLAAAGPDVRMVESLAPMWAEEAARCGGSGIPAPPPSPPRTPQPLSHAVAAVREQFEDAVAGQQPAVLPLSPVGLAPQQEQRAQQEEVPAGTPEGQPALASDQSLDARAATPATGLHASPGILPTPAVQGTPLLALTQAANQAALVQAQQGQQGSVQGCPMPAPTPLPAQPSLPPFVSTDTHQGLALHPQAGAAAAAAGEQTPATPAFELFAQPTQHRLQGWQAGAAPLLNEQLLMTQLTQQLQRQQAAHWPLSHPQRQGSALHQPAEGSAYNAGPWEEEGQGQPPLELDADAWAYLQARLPPWRAASSWLCASTKSPHPYCMALVAGCALMLA